MTDKFPADKARILTARNGWGRSLVTAPPGDELLRHDFLSSGMNCLQTEPDPEPAMTFSFQHNMSGCLASRIGRAGLSDASYAAWLDRLQPHLEALRADYYGDRLPLLRLAEHRADIDLAQAALDQLCEGAETLIFFGTGGSSLGGQTLAHFSEWYVPDAKERRQKNQPQVRFYHNLDPVTLERTLSRHDLARTRFVIISKSGGTSETVLQALAALQAVREQKLADRISQLFLFVTEPETVPGSNGMRALAAHFNIPVLDHPPLVGGRYSVLSVVGLLPALARGVDVVALRAGAASVIDQLLNAGDVAQFSPAAGAAASVALALEKDIRARVMMPYVDRLGRLANWWVQLWAESLGKNSQGTTPIAALGPVDQHSQLQLFLDGPPDHMITLIRTDCSGTGPRIDPALAALAGADCLQGRTAGDLVAAEQNAIYDALLEAGRPVEVIDLNRLDAAALGELMMHFMLETILAGRLLSIDPFDQPAVETGKIKTRAYLAKTCKRPSAAE